MTLPLAARHKQLLRATLVLCLLGGATLYWQGPSLRTWYHIRGLSRATESDRESWVRSAVAHQDVLLPALCACFHRDDERACANAGAALVRITQGWEPDDARRAALAGRLTEGLTQSSQAGLRAALAVAVELPAPDAVVPPELAGNLAQLVAHATQHNDGTVRTLALNLAQRLVERTPSADVIPACRAAVSCCLQDEQPEVRRHAIRVAQCPGLDLLERVVPLLDDPAASVRQAALVAVGAARDAVADDELLRWLHDPDGAVRQLCEQALRGRGLQDQHLKLGRLLTDRTPGTRLQVLEQLRRANDLEPGVWLRRLSHDADPAVRAAAVRAAAEQPFVDLRDRLEQMARNDPSPSVRQLAEFYLRARQRDPQTPVTR